MRHRTQFGIFDTEALTLAGTPFELRSASHHRVYQEDLGHHWLKAGAPETARALAREAQMLKLLDRRFELLDGRWLLTPDFGRLVGRPSEPKLKAVVEELHTLHALALPGNLPQQEDPRALVASLMEAPEYLRSRAMPWVERLLRDLPGSPGAAVLLHGAPRLDNFALIGHGSNIKAHALDLEHVRGGAPEEDWATLWVGLKLDRAGARLASIARDQAPREEFFWWGARHAVAIALARATRLRAPEEVTAAANLAVEVLRRSG